MVELTHIGVKSVVAPPLVPVERAIDLEHLSRMTLGDVALEREVLGLFLRQIEVLKPRISATHPDAAGAAAHTLKGSAAAIGAWAIVRAAEAVEDSCRDVLDGGSDALECAIDLLDRTVARATSEIADSLRSGAN